MLQTLLNVTEQWECVWGISTFSSKAPNAHGSRRHDTLFAGPLSLASLPGNDSTAEIHRPLSAEPAGFTSASLKSCTESYHFSLGNRDVQCLSQQRPYPEIWSGDITQFHLLLPLVLISLWNNRCIPSPSALYGGWAAQWNPIAIECSQSGGEQPHGLISFWLQMLHYNIISNTNKSINFCQ